MNPVWIFDLDNTLHNANPHIFPHINRSMTQYLQEHLSLTESEANALRVDYWQRYGATLSGLMRHHGTCPHHFLWHTHQFPDLSVMLLKESSLPCLLKRLPGKKLVFTNGPLFYAEAVLNLLGIRRLFDDVIAVEHTRFFPKPHARGFLAIMQKHRLNPNQCWMVEDSLENLFTAKRLGMKTIWLSQTFGRPAYVDIKCSHIMQLPKQFFNFQTRTKA